MNNLSKNKGQRLIDRYRGGAEKVYDLCDFINKKAMNWYALNIEFSPDEIEIITKVQQTMNDMIEIRKKVDEDEDSYDYLDLGYDIYINNCRKCNGKVKVIRFETDGFGYDFNVYKCLNCGEEIQEQHPNDPEHMKKFYAFMYEMLDVALLLEIANDKDKDPLRKQLKELQCDEKTTLVNRDDIYKARDILKEAVLSAIEANGQIYKELFKYKYYFDRNQRGSLKN